MVAKQMRSSPKSVTQALTGIGFAIESRRLPGGNKKPRLYAVPDVKKWKEMVSRYFYTEEDDAPAEAPDVLRGSKYVVCPEPSQVSQVSQEITKPADLRETGTDGTDGTLMSTRNNGDDDMPDYPHESCFACKGMDYWLTDWNEWLCSRCHPKPGGGVQNHQ